MSTRHFHNLTQLEERYGQMTLGRFIRAFRESAGLGQAEYARSLNISRANLCDLEKGRKQLSLARAARIAKRMHLPIELVAQLALQDALRAAKLPYKVNLKVA
jgi:transcriptional regulator with XRE-family HTH domain